jgi:ferredoxin
VLEDKSLCIGCEVCALSCKKKALKMEKRHKRVILQCLERGTLENQLFDNPKSKSQRVMWYLGILTV